MEIVSTQKCLLFGSYIFVYSYRDFIISYSFCSFCKNRLDTVYFKYRLILSLIHSFHVYTYSNIMSIM